MKKLALAAIVLVAGLSLAQQASAASTWTDSPTAIESAVIPYCSVLDAKNCQVGATRLDLSWGIGDPYDEGQYITLYRKAGKKYVRTPAGVASIATQLSGVGNHTAVYPQADKFTPGTYLLMMTDNQRAQWKCSVYWKDVCRWVGASSFSTVYRFKWTGTAIEPNSTQLNFAFK